MSTQTTAGRHRAPRHAAPAPRPTTGPSWTQTFPPAPKAPRLRTPARRAPRSPLQAPVAWAPSTSPTLRVHGYTLATSELQVGQRVAQWPAVTSLTIASLERLTEQGTLITYTDGTLAVVGAGASFAHNTSS